MPAWPLLEADMPRTLSSPSGHPGSDPLGPCSSALEVSGSEAVLLIQTPVPVLCTLPFPAN